jgi:hypothetical protein
MYFGLFNKNNTYSLTNSRRIATPASGFLPGKRHATPIMPYVIGAAPTIYLFVSRTEALLMASNTSYHKRLHGLHQFVYHTFASFTACKRLAVLMHNFGRVGNILLYFI